MDHLKRALAKARKRYVDWRKTRDEKKKLIERDRRRRKVLREYRKKLLKHRAELERTYNRLDKDARPERADALKMKLVEANIKVQHLNSKLNDLTTRIDRVKPRLRTAKKRVRWYVQVRLPQVRRKIKRKREELDSRWSPTGSGIVYFDGKQVAEWIGYRLEMARAAGWKGVMTSGYRSPEYSESLCYDICGRPSCPGLCAGRSSNHAGRVMPAGACDCTDYYTLRAIFRAQDAKTPGPCLINRLPYDLVHNSASGY